MMYSRGTIAAVLLAASFTVCAERPDSRLADPDLKPQAWQTVSEDMSADEYRRAYRHNQDMLRDLLNSYSKGALSSIGVPRSGIKLMGAAAGLAVNQDAKLYLNRSRILALEVKDVADEDRSLFFGIQFDW